MNKLQPNSIPKFTTSGGDFKLRENISLFRKYTLSKAFQRSIFSIEIILENAARAYGLAESELFQSIDLFEKRNIPQVTQCLYTLGRHVSDRFYQMIISSSSFS